MSPPRMHRVALAASLVLFGLSGAASLVYEVSWARQFGNVLGHTVYSSSLVLASLMVGLGAGYAWGTRLGVGAGRWRPLVWYGALELFAAIWACAVPWMLSAVPGSGLASLDAGPWHSLEGLRVLVALAILLPATAALGASWPVMAASLLASDASPRWLSLGYAINTAGALAGSVCASAWLLPGIGVRASSYLAAALAAGCGLAAIGLAYATGSEVPREKPQQALLDDGASARPRMWPWLLLAGLSGFSILALEVLYLRVFSLVLHNSTYSFGAVLAIFLLALALGSALTGLIGRRLSPANLAAIACGCGGLAVVLSLAVFVRWTDFRYVTAGGSHREYLTAVAWLAAAVTLPPIVLLGIILPVTWRANEPAPANRADVARLTAVSTLASAAGSLAASFGLPVLGLWGSLLAIAAVLFACGLGIFWLQRRTRACLGLMLLAVLVGGYTWDVCRRARALLPGDTLVARWEGAYGWIDVVELPDRSRRVRQNLHYSFGSSRYSVDRDYRQGNLPLLLHGQARDAAFLGLGTGQTSAAALGHTGLESIVVVELIPEAIPAARLFGSTNRGVVDDPRVEVRVADARHFLAVSGRKFDVIVSDLFVPWESHTGYLYTVEHYRASQQALRPGGLFCQWLPLFQLAEGEFELIADSFASVFPHVTLWWAEARPGVAVIGLVGTAQPLEFDRTGGVEGLNLPADAPGASDPNLATGEAVLSQLVGRWTVRSPDWLNTDEHPRVEFQAPASYAGRRMLSGERLREYFERRLVPLEDGVTLGNRGGKARSRTVWLELQRKRLAE